MKHRAPQYDLPLDDFRLVAETVHTEPPRPEPTKPDTTQRNLFHDAQEPHQNENHEYTNTLG